ncbi:DnaB-like helicase N-terminal domain-containing protein [Kitasatospora sp. NPDC008115]|uniref:DnaB-like helicase N-terminal domain-containing protein n=1 Tax=Kitasatospora sp. NPDC008115 TaxID=3364022 RepID=UPI0036E5A672
MSEQEPGAGGPAFEVPHDLRAEQLLLGATMLSKDAIADVVETLRSSSFYRPAHELIYNAVLELYADDPTDPIKIAGKLTEQVLLARASGRDYLRKLSPARLWVKVSGWWPAPRGGGPPARCSPHRHVSGRSAPPVRDRGPRSL